MGERASGKCVFGDQLWFSYTTIKNVIERPDGIKIASYLFLAYRCFFISRAYARRLRVGKIECDEPARGLLMLAEGESYRYDRRETRR